MNSKHFVLMVLSTFVLLGVAYPVAADDRPNILFSATNDSAPGENRESPVP
jgi:hypothetical protein